MTLPPDPAHVSMEELLEYFDGQLPAAAEESVELRLSGCDECARVSKEIHSLQHVWAGWTAQSHGKLYLRVTLARALAKAETQTLDPSWRERLKRWREAWAGTAEAALHTVFQAPAAAAHVVGAGLDALSRPGSLWQFAPETSFAGTLGEDDEDEESSLFTTSTLSPDTPRALVELKGGDKGDVVVRIDNLPLGSTPPLVVLIAVSPEHEVIVQVTEVKRQPGTNSFIAHFAKVLPGEYIVAFEPLEASPGRGP